MSSSVASAASGSASSASLDVASLIEKAIATQEYGVLDIPTNRKYSLDARFLLYKYIVYGIYTIYALVYVGRLYRRLDRPGSTSRPGRYQGN